MVLFMIGSAVSLAVVTINARNRQEGMEVDFDPVATFLMLCGVGFCMVASGAVAKILVHAVRKDATKGQFIKLAIGGIIVLGIGIGLFVAAANQ